MNENTRSFRMAFPLPSYRSTIKALWVLTLIGIFIRVGLIFFFNDYQHPATVEYGIVANHLVTGKGFAGGGWLGPEAPTALNTPIYPLVLAGALKLAIQFGLPEASAYLGVELMQAILSGLMIYLIGWVVTHIADSRIGLITAALTTIYLPFLYFNKQLSPATLTAFFTILSLSAVLFLLQKPSFGRAIWTGVLFGIAMLAEPILALAIPGAIIIAGIHKYRLAQISDYKPLSATMAVCVVICALTILPWTIRNAVVFNRLIPFKTSFGLNLWMGNNANATGYLYTTDGTPIQYTIPASELTKLSALNEADRYALMEREAWAWIASHPVSFVELTAKRFLYFWWMSPTYQVTDQNIAEPAYYYALRSILQLLILSFAAIGGIIAVRKHRYLLTMCVWYMVAFTAPYVISVAGNTRYRLPAEPFALALVAVTLITGYELLQIRLQNGKHPHQ
jgi:hypothetical protein